MSQNEAPAVRPCGLCDAALLAALHETCFPEDPWNDQAMAELLALPTTWGFLSIEQEQPLGFILLRQVLDELEILTFGVLPDKRGQGLARFLLSEVISQARGRGVTEMFLEVAEDNVPALFLYKGMGFQPVGKRPGYYQRPQGKACDALIFKLSGSVFQQLPKASKNS